MVREMHSQRHNRHQSIFGKLDFQHKIVQQGRPKERAFASRQQVNTPFPVFPDNNGLVNREVDS